MMGSADRSERSSRVGRAGTCAITLALAAFAVTGAFAQSASVYYICPGNVFTNAITAKEAQQRGCKAREAREPTTFEAPKPRPVASPTPRTTASPSSSSSRPDMKVDPDAQRKRDSDARAILSNELQSAETRLAQLKTEYNGGQPERRGDERNYQRYLDRVEELKASIQRQEADVAAIRRELGKLGPDR